VLDDVLEGRCSPEVAEAAYDVVLDTTGRSVDEDATSRARGTWRARGTRA
jgi:hypothetical protein